MVSCCYEGLSLETTKTVREGVLETLRCLMPVSDLLAADLNFATGEITVNAIKHGGDCDLSVEILVEDDEAELSYIASSHMINHKQIDDAIRKANAIYDKKEAPPSVWQVGGRGIIGTREIGEIRRAGRTITLKIVRANYA